MTVELKRVPSPLSACMKAPKNMVKQTAQAGFTLIELLVVISVIAILAGLLVGLAPQATARIRESRTRSELQKLITGIEAYKARFGVYPPDHVTGRAADGMPVVDPVINPLFYELTGVMVVRQGSEGYFVPVGDQDRPDVRLTPNQLETVFARDGFVNAQLTNGVRRLFRMDFKESQHAELSQNPDIELLVAPVPWPPANSGFPPPIPSRPRLNPWRYNSSNPVHNPGSYDLWAEIIVRGRKEIIGNWRN